MLSQIFFKEGMSGSPMHQQYVCNAKEEPAESVIAQILDGWQGSLVSKQTHSVARKQIS
jgi:hypothetical protein